MKVHTCYLILAGRGGGGRRGEEGPSILSEYQFLEGTCVTQAFKP